LKTNLTRSSSNHFIKIFLKFNLGQFQTVGWRSNGHYYWLHCKLFWKKSDISMTSYFPVWLKVWYTFLGTMTIGLNVVHHITSQNVIWSAIYTSQQLHIDIYRMVYTFVLRHVPYLFIFCIRSALITSFIHVVYNNTIVIQLPIWYSIMFTYNSTINSVYDMFLNQCSESYVYLDLSNKSFFPEVSASMYFTQS
jgi:hypothetical protein